MTATERSQSQQFTSRVSAPILLQAIMQLEQAKTRAKAANRVAMDAEKEKDAAEQEVQRLQQCQTGTSSQENSSTCYNCQCR
jgi:hypothetical protein